MSLTGGVGWWCRGVTGALVLFSPGPPSDSGGVGLPGNTIMSYLTKDIERRKQRKAQRPHEIAKLCRMIQNQKHLNSILLDVEDELERATMFERMTPHLRFKAEFPVSPKDTIEPS